MSSHDYSDSSVVGREPCPDCGSSDNLTRYSDGHAFCFGQGCGRFEPGDGDEYTPATTDRKRPRMSDLLTLEYIDLTKRKLKEETCRKFRYGTSKNRDGKGVQAATYFDQEGNPAGQKLRFASKKDGMPWVGSAKGVQLFGQHLWSGTGKMIVITEGEIDAMSVSQMQNNKWPVVSLINGASGAAKDIKANLQFLSGYDKVILMFDQDEAGKGATEEAVRALPAGKAYIATLPLKDANECLVAGRGDEIVQALWNAKAWVPDGIVAVSDIKEEAKRPVTVGLPWVYDTLTKLTHGRRFRELYAVGAGTGVGKTDFLTEQVAHDITELGQTVGVVMLEQKPTETLKRLAGKLMNRRFHVPDAGWTEEELDEGIERLDGKVHFYDSFGETEWDVVETQIRYMVSHLGHKIIYLDHLTAMADTSNERESLEQIMKEMAGLANELDCMIIFVSHLATPEGKPHEEGGRVTIRHFKGSRAIGFWSYFMFGLERDQQAEDPQVRQRTTFRCLKDRYTGQATGATFALTYDAEHGRLIEAPEFEDEFADETGGFSPRNDDDIPF